MLILGFFLSLIGFGINKRIWSPSYVFVTCGFAAWILSLLIQWIDRGEISTEGKTEANAEGIDGKVQKEWMEKCGRKDDKNKGESDNSSVFVFRNESTFPLCPERVPCHCFRNIRHQGRPVRPHQKCHFRRVSGFPHLCPVFVAIHAAMGIWMYQKKIFIKL